MTWLALCDHDDRRLSLRGLGTDKKESPQLEDTPATLLTRGSIMFETRLSADGRPQVLFGYKTTFPAMRSLTFQAIPGGGIAMVQVQNGDISHAAIKHAEAGRTDVVRITYSWDSTLNWGRMTLEKPEETEVTSVYIDNPRALSLEDIRDLMLGRSDQTFASDMIFAALSDQIEPIGPMPTLLPGTPLATPWGYKDANKLQRGDTVITREAGIVPVLQHVGRTVPARGSFCPIRLRAPYFGLQQDIIVAPDQRLIIDGPEVEYLFSQEAVLVPARHLVNGFAALTEPCGPMITYSQLLLPRHETLLAAGTSVESLYIGRIRRNNQHLQSSLLHSFDRALLPEHPRPAHHVLRWFDAIHLARRRAA
ncbi:Hint domain-containing protein [Sulfitobacter sp. F26204]|uniref:Hint domain-containing protein n=1 Tax=Sulfitobacter sp. F26204 TaxID=2996014 RepID=UPI00225E3AB7|nr:Hint domain-containing protein [Sulfitobacter sp. F26204]MCX7558140.1 Hint domain-containing protein [Sulfitobacter sp. F26204]